MWHAMVILGILLLVIPIFIRLFFQLPYIISGSLIPIVILLLIQHYIQLEKFNEIEYLRQRSSKFSFYRGKSWLKNTEILKTGQAIPIDAQQIYPENFIINDTLNNIITLILRDFVQGWFQKISQDQSFIVSLRHEFSHIIRNLHSRFVEVDFANLVVHNLVPVLNDHIEKFLVAQDVTKNKKIINKSVNNDDKTMDIDDDSILASNYNRGKLHSGIRYNSNNPESDMTIYLSSLMDKVLPYLVEPTELKSSPVKILLRELLASNVLIPICSMFSNPDFFNQIIESTLTKQMRERNDVKRLRHVLRRHSMTFDYPQSDPSFDLLQYKLTLETSKQDYEILLKTIENCSNKENLLKYKYYTLLQNEKTLKFQSAAQIEESKVIQNYIKRLNKLVNIINYKLNKNKNSVNDDKAGSLTLNKSDTDVKKLMRDFTLHEILTSSTKLKFLITFMEERGDRLNLLHFWLSAENLRNPLEFNIPITDKETPLNYLELEDEDLESSDDETLMFLDKDLTQANDIVIIFEKYFQLSVMKIPPKIFYKVSEFIEGNCTNVLAYHRARKNIFKLQDFEYDRMKKSDFVAFKNSDLWLKLLVEEAVSKNKSILPDEINATATLSTAMPNLSENTLLKSYQDKESSGDPLAKYSEKENDGSYLDVNMTGKVSDKVIKAVEDALSEIMKDSGKTDIYAEFNNKNNDKRSSRLVSDDLAKDLFGADEESLFKDTDIDSEDGVLQKSTPALTNDNDNIDVNKEDDSENVKLKNEDNGIESTDDSKVSTSNVLNLSTEIERLSSEISKLEEQQLIIQTLLKKAEIINNVPESRVLKKSLISLEKELKLKSMQKEQFIVQEGENSLYGRSVVTITSYIPAKDKNGKNFMMYVIKVIKLSQPDPNKVRATWMVTRRFSQFYELHNYLKTKYPEISKLEFPKRTVVMKFIQSSVLEERQRKLKVYLNALIKNKDVCSDKVFRDFLSSENFDASENTIMDYNNNNNRNNVNNKTNKSNNVKKNVDGSGTKLYNIVSSQELYPLLSLANSKSISEQVDGNLLMEKSIDDLSNMHDSNESLSTIDAKSKDVTFIKPICDLIVSIFQLNSSTSWLRGKALILLFQQIFGSTLEKILRNNIDGKLKQEDNVSQLLMALQFKLWPYGNFKKSSIPRTPIEKQRSKQQTRLLLHVFLADTTSKIFGQAASDEAAETLYIIFQNEILNCHLILIILDEIFQAIFPEIIE